MNLAAIFAFLLASGVCGQSVFRAPDGGQLAVVVCPRAIPADDAAPNAAPDASPDATPDPGAYDTPSQPLKPGQKRT